MFYKGMSIFRIPSTPLSPWFHHLVVWNGLTGPDGGQPIGLGDRRQASPDEWFAWLQIKNPGSPVKEPGLVVKARA